MKKTLLSVLFTSIVLVLSACMTINPEHKPSTDNSSTIKDQESASIESFDNEQYEKAVELFENEEYEEALEIFSTLNENDDIKKYVDECRYSIASDCLNNGDYFRAHGLLLGIKDYKDAKNLLEKFVVVYTKETEINSEGDEQNTFYTYNNSGLLIKKTTMSYNGSKSSEDKYTYNSNNLLENHYFLSYYDGYSQDINYFYDNENKLIKKTYKYLNPYGGDEADEFLTDITEYTYDSNNNLIKECCVKSDDTIETVEYVYDTHGQLAEKTTSNDEYTETYIFEHDNSLVSKETYLYDHKTNNNYDYEYTSQFFYDENNLKTKELYRSIDRHNTYEYTYEYIYDQNDLLVESITTHSDGTQSRDTYTYNENGILIEYNSDNYATKVYSDHMIFIKP